MTAIDQRPRPQPLVLLLPRMDRGLSLHSRRPIWRAAFAKLQQSLTECTGRLARLERDVEITTKRMAAMQAEIHAWNGRNRPAPQPGHPSAGFRQWELRQGHHVLACEFCDNEGEAAGVDVQLFKDGDVLLSTRCITGESARYVAEAFRQDHLRTGWTAVEADDRG